MMKKSTLFKHVELNEDHGGDKEDLEVKMEESEYSTGDTRELYSPSDKSVKAILDFASSYFCIKSKSLDFIDMNLN